MREERTVSGGADTAILRRNHRNEWREKRDFLVGSTSSVEQKDIQQKEPTKGTEKLSTRKPSAS